MPAEHQVTFFINRLALSVPPGREGLYPADVANVVRNLRQVDLINTRERRHRQQEVAPLICLYSALGGGQPAAVGNLSRAIPHFSALPVRRRRKRRAECRRRALDQDNLSFATRGTIQQLEQATRVSVLDSRRLKQLSTGALILLRHRGDCSRATARGFGPLRFR